ncbi:hypothetical protein [Actinoplanes couchii]|uniref:MmyB family transcriptional regulator n=1 Tax=Actinoplanes couchii TaxID=403638 RepID=UPI001942DE39|nr:hypothetical protein [Actinoplanes couchii]MDR6318203.1 hypothetical protein [Actinoplanes couchii]
MDRVSPTLRLVVDHLPDCPVMVFSRSGAVLWRNGPAVALFGDGGVEVLDRRGDLASYRRQVLVDPVEGQILLILI